MSAADQVKQHPAFQQASAKANYYVSQFDKELTKYPALAQLEQRTQVPKTWLVGGSVALLFIFHLFNSLAAPVSNFVGWGLPAYLSFRALESPGHADDIQWLTYWVVFGAFNFTESVALRPVLYYFPWYFAAKTLFVLWLQLPITRGAEKAYHAVLKPVLVNANQRVVSATQPDTNVTAENLRDRVATANAE
ncbi:hypothetical protein CONPUDRAFT_44497 [Coniophora puteana RWD-64-598 SS2]|uniref:Protein YOP1 n=1 Tax=Coniophora puteana (strain RWD-64-598) TaxID=741705 RepID=A0A5M3N499_CONPW|nr:uncharacterized protein CONPUDRAFT_44497 [Coniophora puteana RWD-64-598 SS2]EIW86250.1 hypothetical protein CONPUDRAFT_44497 [Coniophora puteana RWD-64-598 SS2]